MITYGDTNIQVIVFVGLFVFIFIILKYRYKIIYNNQDLSTGMINNYLV